MQTFLPYPSFAESAAVLDRQRLGKQRVECLQLLDALVWNGRWRHHPAAKMWAGSESWLANYGLYICDAWLNLGYKDTCFEKIQNYFAIFDRDQHAPPSWLGDPDFHAAHRSNLLRKDPEWYGKFGWSEPPDLPYIWPVNKHARNL